MGTRIPGRQALGILGGLAGILALNAGKELSGQGSVMVLLTFGSISWALGSVFAKKASLPGPTIAAGIQMVAGGCWLALAAAVHGESIPQTASTASIAALVYLLIFGSLVGFSAYSYLLRHASMPVATSYAYVNPLVAVVIGTTLGGEHLDPAGWVGLALVVSSVALVTTTPPTMPRAAPEPV
jgi:drug/metabolite transporter (DMT)-like permease